MTTSVERHQWARPVVIAAWARVFPGDRPDLTELQTIQAQGAHEGWYGFASNPPQWAGSNNWGAIDYLDGDENRIEGCVGYFEWQDTTASGQVIPVRFRSYATPLDGAADLIREALVRRHDAWNVIDEGNLLSYAAELRKDHYFVAPADVYASALFAHAKDIASALGEPLSVRLDSGFPKAASLGPLLLLAAGAIAAGYWSGAFGRLKLL